MKRERPHPGRRLFIIENETDPTLARATNTTNKQQWIFSRNALVYDNKQAMRETLLRDAFRSHGHLFAQPDPSYPSIEQDVQQYPVRIMCQVPGVSGRYIGRRQSSMPRSFLYAGGHPPDGVRAIPVPVGHSHGRSLTCRAGPSAQGARSRVSMRCHHVMRGMMRCKRFLLHEPNYTRATDRRPSSCRC